MWEYEYRASATIEPEQIWRHWADPTGWPEWNPGVASIDVDGPFEVGTGFVMTDPGGDAVALRIVEIEDGRSFTDELDAGDFVVRTSHRLEVTDAGTTVVYRTEITGPAADGVGPELGPQITADFPEVVEALLRRAQS